jgi:transcriptional regulator with XRE-family HTH domain
MSKICGIFGKKVRDLRISQGLTQEELGEKAGLHYKYIGAIERGERNLSLESIEKIAKGLGIGIGELFSFTSQKKSVGEIGLMKKEIMKLFKNKDLRTLRFVSRILKEVIQWIEEY